MKILLTHGYFLHEDEKEQHIMRPYAPLGILYISAYLEQQNVDHEVYDTTFSRKEDFKDHLLKEKPDIIAFYTNLMTKLNVIEMIRYIRSTPSLAHATIIQGGPDITYNVENYLAQGADILVLGEGEESMLALIHALRDGQNDWSNINGIAFRNEAKQVIKTAPRIKIKAIDNLPFPNRKKIELQKYIDTWKTHHGQSAISVSTQRGCPYTCKWCSTAVYGQSYRRRSPEQVVDELELLMKEYQPDTFWFVDDVFTVSHKWLAAFAATIKKRGLQIAYECISRADRMNEEVIALLKESGCARIWIGAESGSQKIIDAMDRRVDVTTVQDMIQKSREHGIEAGTFIMLGYPGETQDDIEKTIQHLKNSNPDYFTITIAYPIKGTGLYEEVEAIQAMLPEWSESTDRDRDFKRTYSRRYYDFAVKYVVNEVHYYKKQLANKQFSKDGIQHLLKSKVAKAVMNWERLKKQPVT